MRAPAIWGLVFGGIQAASPLAFWWLDTATVYALSPVLIASVYIGFAVADGRRAVLAFESGVAAIFVVVAAAAVTGSPWLLVLGLTGHGLKDLWQHRRQFVANTRGWPPFCLVVDWVRRGHHRRRDRRGRSLPPLAARASTRAPGVRRQGGEDDDRDALAGHVATEDSPELRRLRKALLLQLGAGVLTELERYKPPALSHHARLGREIPIVLFSRLGFGSRLVAEAQRREQLRLVGLDELVAPQPR